MVKSVSDPPIRVVHVGEYWRVDYGSYMDGFHATRAEATATATVAGFREHRKLEIDEPGQDANDQVCPPSGEEIL